MQGETIREAGRREVKCSDCHRNVENGLEGQGEGEQLPALGVPLTCEWRCSGLEGRFPPGASGLFLLRAKQHSFLLPRLERSSVPPWGDPGSVRDSRPWSRESPTSSLSLWALEKLTLTPIKAASLQETAEGKLPAQGESKGARTAGQSAFPSWGSQHPPPDSCNHLLTAHAALLLISLPQTLYISTRMLFLRCNSDHVPLLLKILQQVPKIFGREILTILHGIQAPSCFGFLTTSHSPSPVRSS